jgi:hypothetical protein
MDYDMERRKKENGRMNGHRRERKQTKKSKGEGECK